MDPTDPKNEATGRKRTHCWLDPLVRPFDQHNMISNPSFMLYLSSMRFCKLIVTKLPVDLRQIQELNSTIFKHHLCPKRNWLLLIDHKLAENRHNFIPILTKCFLVSTSNRLMMPKDLQKSINKKKQFSNFVLSIKRNKKIAI